MFGLTLPEHVRITLDPNPEDGGKTFVLVITASGPDDGGIAAEPLTLNKTIPRDIGAIQFGKDLMAAMNHLSKLIKKR